MRSVTAALVLMASVLLSADARAAAGPAISGLSVSTTFTSASFVFATSEPASATISIGTSKSVLLATVDKRYRPQHTITVQGLAPNTAYVAQVAVAAQTGKPAKRWLSVQTAAPESSPVTASTRKGKILINGQAWMPVAAEYLNASCGYPSDPAEANTVQSVAALRVNVFINGVENCGMTQSDVLAAIAASKLWYADMLPNTDWPAPDSPFYFGPNPAPPANFIGWQQSDAPEYFLRPDQLSDPPAAGRLTFLNFSVPFWNGENPSEWAGSGQGPSWNAATTQAYFSKADVLGYNQSPYGGSCWTYPATKTYDAVKSLVATSGKPALEWVSLTPYLPARCHPGPLTPAEVESQVWLGIEAGAAGIGFLTVRTGVVGVPYGVDTDIANATEETIAQLNTIAPCLLTGANVGVASSLQMVKVRACRYGGATYVFATNAGNRAATASITTSASARSAQVLWEGRSVKLAAGSIFDSFQPLATHIYRISPR